MPLLERPSPTPGPLGHQLPAWLADLFFTCESSASALGPLTQDLPPCQSHCGDTKKANLVLFQPLTVEVEKEKGGQLESSGTRSVYHRSLFPNERGGRGEAEESARTEPTSPRGLAPAVDPGSPVCTAGPPHRGDTGTGLGTSLQPPCVSATRQLPSCSVSWSTRRAGGIAGERTAAHLLAEAAGPAGTALPPPGGVPRSQGKGLSRAALKGFPSCRTS